MLKFSISLLLILAVIKSSGLLVLAYSQANNQNMPSSDIQKNKDIIVQFTKAINERNFTAIDNLVAKNIIEHRPGVGQGIDATKGFIRALQTAFPDFKTVLNHVIAEGDKVVVYTNTTGTFKGPFMFAPGVKPTGKTYSFQTADLYRIQNGEIAEHWDVIEIMDMLLKIGAIQFVNNLPLQPPLPSSLLQR